MDIKKKIEEALATLSSAKIPGMEIVPVDPVLVALHEGVTSLKIAEIVYTLDLGEVAGSHFKIKKPLFTVVFSYAGKRARLDMYNEEGEKMT